MEPSSAGSSRWRAALGRLDLIWRKWTRPRDPDHENVLREHTLRVAVPIFVLLDLLNIICILAFPQLPDSRAISWLVYMLACGVAVWLIVRGRINAASVLIGCIAFLAVGVTQVRQGYWSGFTYAVMGLALMFCAFVLSRRLTMVATLALSVEYTAITLWQAGAGVPYPNPLRDLDALASPSMAIVVGILYLFVTLTLGSFLVDEFIANAAALRQLADTLEQRVADRTAELETAYEQVKALNRVKDEFVSNVSHELSTPITSIMLTEYSLEQQATGDQRTRLDTLKRETERLKKLIDALLLLSRLDQERVPFAFAVVDVNALVEEYARDRTGLAQDQGLALDVELSPEGPRVWADGSLLGMVLSILLTNAFNYTPSGGQVMIRTEVRSDDGTSWAGFSVKDTGSGVVPDEQLLVFKRFFRGKAGHDCKVSGTGLGLAIAREIVERHHGQIAVESPGIPGQGSLFRVWLPRRIWQP
jgi:signal transduction histidine kinase